MKKEQLIFGVPDIGLEEEKAVLRVLRSKWIGFGNESLAFEAELRKYIGVKAGIAVSSCTAALHLALVVSGLKEGDEIITTPFTFAATANAILYTGAKPVFVDIDPTTLNLDPSQIERSITKKTKGILVVHFGGLPADMKRINAIAKKHTLFVVEDAAHALGARSEGKPVGNSNNLSCFSFYPNKNLTTIEGGFLASNNAKLIEHAAELRVHGLGSNAWKRFKDKDIFVSQATALGYKYNTTDVQSAIGRVQLKKFPANQKKRHEYAKLYDRILSGVPGITLQPKPDSLEERHALHLYTVVIDPKQFTKTRDELVAMLRASGIFAVVHYHPLHLHPFYKKLLGYKTGDFKKTEAAGLNILTLPLLPQFTRKEAERVATTAREILLGALRP